MENLQLENGFMRIANEIVDELFKLPLNSTDQKVIWCVLRYTFGFNRKSHRLSASFIAQWSNCDLRSVKRALRKLQENKIIICMNSEKKGVTAELMFNKNVRQWLITSDKNDTIISMVLRMDDVKLLDLAFGFVRGCCNQQIKKEQEAENNGEV